MTLTACASSGRLKPTSLAPVPGDIRACFNHLVPAPKRGSMSKRQVVELIAALKKSEVSKSQCGQRLIKFYENQSP